MRAANVEKMSTAEKANERQKAESRKQKRKCNQTKHETAKKAK
jgi:hypothetical protein